MSEENKDIKADFEDFVSEKDPVPRRISEKILAAIHRQIYPSRARLFLKVFTIHLLVSCFSLSLCSQFGVRAFEIYDLMPVFMQFVGHTTCLALCGLFYFFLSTSVIVLCLNAQDMYVVRRDHYAVFAAVGGFSFALFLCLGTEVYIFPATLWIVGAFLGLFGGINVGVGLKRFSLKL
jgi:hypothetical protein